MKKFFNVLLALFAMLLLVSCLPQKKSEQEQVELSAAEAAALLDAVNLSESGKNVFSLETEIDLQFLITLPAPEEPGAEEPEDVGLKINGSVNVYADVQEFVGSYIYANVNLSYELVGDIDAFLAPYLEMLMPLAEPPFSLADYSRASVVADIYVIEGIAYVDATITIAGVELSFKRYDVMFTAEDFAASEGEVPGEEGMNITEADILELLEKADLTTYKIGDLYEFIISMRQEDFEALIQEMIADMLGEMLPPGTLVTVTHNGEFRNEISLKFSQKLERVKFTSKMDVLIDVSAIGAQFGINEVVMKTNISVDANF
ncbi:MAG: hypothetical protein RBR46_02550, partial [Acholeplasmatales bacterium]|nr:hypothetical protein [Acholeplasmatales bacterium]